MEGYTVTLLASEAEAESHLHHLDLYSKLRTIYLQLSHVPGPGPAT